MFFAYHLLPALERLDVPVRQMSATVRGGCIEHMAA